MGIKPKPSTPGGDSGSGNTREGTPQGGGATGREGTPQGGGATGRDAGPPPKKPE